MENTSLPPTDDWRADILSTWSTERLKTLQVWKSFQNEDLTWRPPDAQKRGRSVHEHMVHQCVSEDRWCSDMLGLTLNKKPLPEVENRENFISVYAELSAERLLLLQNQDTKWWSASTDFFDTKRSHLWIVMRRLLHTAHHRGQLTAYLRCLQKPLWSTYGPTADTGGLALHQAPTIYMHAQADDLLANSSLEGAFPLPGIPQHKP
jgi:uncharacterized damage-inducible protein DinB